MCTLIRMDQKESPLVAEEDFIVYKIGRKRDNERFSSIYFEFPYLVTILYKTSFTFLYKSDCSVFEDLPVFDGREVDYRESLDKKGIPYCVVAEGFHSLKRLDILRNTLYGDCCHAKFIVPKGSLYYENKSGNVVSDQIIFKEFI